MFIKILFFILKINQIKSDPLVQLPDGLILGREDVNLQDKTFYAFEKIPYAAPPIGNLRFKAPVPPEKWNGILNTTQMDVVCYQNSIDLDSENEDCLYLNVYTPQLPDGDVCGSLPVMLFIHGGGFLGGSAMTIGPDNLMNENVILVAINYRLGIFGFISTQDDVIPGNNGLKDQHLAIKWTHDNIHLFGGDPNKITIFGQSAGGISVAYQLLNPQSEGLFQAAICQSGTFLFPTAYQRNAREIAFRTATSLNASLGDDSLALLEFLQSVPARDLDAAARQNSKLRAVLYPQWTPVIEAPNSDAFITEKMYKLLRDGDFVKVPLLIGETSEESLFFYQSIDPNELKSELAFYDENLDGLVPTDMRITDLDAKIKMGEAIRTIYTGNEPFSDHLGDGIRYVSDNFCSRPIIKHAELYSKFANTYFYIFAYDGSLGPPSARYDGAENVAHCAELAYFFCSDQQCNIDDNPDSDKITRDRLVKLWANFAKYHNPTPKPVELFQNISWPLVTTETGDFLYVEINDNLEIKNHPKDVIYKKWVELYDSLGFDDFDTY